MFRICLGGWVWGGEDFLPHCLNVGNIQREVQLERLLPMLQSLLTELLLHPPPSIRIRPWLHPPSRIPLEPVPEPEPLWGGK